MNTSGTAVMKLSIEVITLPVGDVERALRFYVSQVGASFADFSDPDGNSWVLQERGYRSA